MKSRLLCFLLFASVIAGCQALVMNDHVVGPHGEDLKDIRCTSLGFCYDLAREECKGNYDVVETSSYGSNGQGILVKCPA